MEVLKAGTVLTGKEVAQWLHFTPLTVLRLSRRGVIPAFRIGEQDWRYRADALRNWFEQVGQ